MRSLSALLALFFTLSLAAQQRTSHVPGEVLLRLSREARVADVQHELKKALPAGIQLKEFQHLAVKSLYTKVVVQGGDEVILVRTLAQVPGVEATSLNHRLHFTAQPDDAQYGTQWNMGSINVEPVWDHTTGGTMANGRRIAVGLSDLAIETTHPDLQGNIWPGSPHQGGGQDHGTEVASVMAAVGNNTIGIAGINWDVDIISSGTTSTLADAIEQIELATQLRQQFNATNGSNGLLVASITGSWVFEGTGPCNGFLDPLFSDMADAGILFVTAGPNTATSLEAGTTYPANCALAEHIVVTGYGPDNSTPFAFGPNTVHLLAPGVDIPVATTGGSYTVVDGNSYAVPTVAGAVALLYSIPCTGFAQLVMDDPQAARQRVKDAILQNTTPFPGGSAITITGGKLNVKAAYDALMAQCVPTCTDYTITLTPAGDPVTTWTVTNWDMLEVAQGGGNTIQACLDDGCYSINLNGVGGLPMEADFVVEDGSGVVATGSSFGGIISLSLGDVVSGCTVGGSVNFNPQANCNDGSCCSGEIVHVVVLPADPEAEGTVDLVVTSNGSEVFDGTVEVTFGDEFGMVTGTWKGCVPDGCMHIEVTGSSLPLTDDAFVFLSPGDEPLAFHLPAGFSGPIGDPPAELCDGIDNDCDGQVDEDFIWYTDADGDGWGGFDAGTIMCAPPSSGFAQQQGDCDDNDPAINPDMPDGCATPDGVDNDCSGTPDDVGLQFWYVDLDQDGYGTIEVLACEQLPTLTLVPGDCDDNDPTVHPDAPEICDGIDNDCDGVADPGALWYLDADGDGFGDDATLVASCTPVPGAVQVGGDCDDNDPAMTAPGQPCDDGNPATAVDLITGDCACQGFNPGTCPEGEIEDCNGNCAPLGWVGDGICDDGSFEHNGAFISFHCQAFNFDGGDCTGCVDEVCDGLDNDCDGQVDEDFVWFTDADGDGHGDPATGAILCDPGPGFSLVGDDCDDSNPAAHMGAIEVCDGSDNDCDGIIDGLFSDFQSGCTDPMACNYDPGAVCDDGSCTQGSNANGGDTFATDFTAVDVNGNTVNLFSLLAQGKTVVLDFFTTWCPPSIQMDNAGFLQDWYAHMGPAGLDHIRLVSIEIEDTATVNGSLARFLEDASWPFIATGGSAIMQQYAALDLYNGFVPTLVMICPDRTAQRIYAFPDQLPYSGIFNYDPIAALELLNDRCGCHGIPCMGNVGCMDPTACNYDPSATCPGPCTQAQEWFVDDDGDGHGTTTSLGTLCTQPANSAADSTDCDDADPVVHVGFTLVVLTADENDFGSAHYVIEHGGGVIEGDLDLPAGTQGVGELPLCLGYGCFAITITQNDVPLYEESFIIMAGASEDPIAFTTFDGYLGGQGSQEVCDGIDNDCDGSVDEGFALLFADADADGYGDPDNPIGCSGNGVPDASDCDDTDPDQHPGMPELCNGLDDDCDGIIDEDFDLGAPCGAGGIVVCDGTGGVTCTQPAVEVCGNGIDDDGDALIDEGCPLRLIVRMALEGPYDPSTGLMNDALRSQGLLPTTEPYSSLGHPHSGAESTEPSLLATAGNDAIVDWVLLELRHPSAPHLPLTSRAALLQRDGDVVDVDGSPEVSFHGAAPGAYHLVIRHRNHLGCMTASALQLAFEPTSIDLTLGGTDVHGDQPRKAITGAFPVHALWAGDVSFDRVIKYTGGANDRDLILQRIGGTAVTATSTGYHPEDVDLDGTVKYTGADNDRDPVLINVGGVVPTQVRVEQVP